MQVGKSYMSYWFVTCRHICLYSRRYLYNTCLFFFSMHVLTTCFYMDPYVSLHVSMHMPCIFSCMDVAAMLLSIMHLAQPIRLSPPQKPPPPPLYRIHRHLQTQEHTFSLPNRRTVNTQYDSLMCEVLFFLRFLHARIVIFTRCGPLLYHVWG